MAKFSYPGHVVEGVECIDLLSSEESSDNEGPQIKKICIAKLHESEKLNPSSSQSENSGVIRRLGDFEYVKKIVITHPPEYLADIYELLFLNKNEINADTLRNEILDFTGFTFEKGSQDYVKRKQVLDGMLYSNVQRVYNTLIYNYTDDAVILNSTEVKVSSKPTMINEIMEFLFKLPDHDPNPFWQGVAKICDMINKGKVTPKDVLNRLKENLLVKNPHVVLNTLLVIESVVQREKCFSEEVAKKHFIEWLQDFTMNTSYHCVKIKIMKLLQFWSSYFVDKVPHFRMVRALEDLKSKEHEILKNLETLGNTYPEWPGGHCCWKCEMQLNVETPIFLCACCAEIFCFKCIRHAWICKNCSKLKSSGDQVIIGPKKSSLNDLPKIQAVRRSIRIGARNLLKAKKNVAAGVQVRHSTRIREKNNLLKLKKQIAFGNYSKVIPEKILSVALKNGQTVITFKVKDIKVPISAPVSSFNPQMKHMALEYAKDHPKILKITYE